MRKLFLLLSLCLALPNKAENPLKIKLRSRALLDASISDYNKDEIQGFYKLEDFRIGFKAQYQQYSLTADVGLTDKKVNIKDFLLRYQYKHHTFAIGNGYDPFAMDVLISTPDMRFHQTAASAMAFCDSRKVGFTYSFSNPSLYAATGVFTDSDINHLGKEENSNALLSTSRVVWRKRTDERLFHLGTAFSIQTPPANKETTYAGSFSSKGVTSLFNETMLNAEIPGIRQKMRGVAEFLFTNQKWLFQGEYFYNRVHYRKDGAKAVYNPFGGYVQTSFLAIGEGFQYDAANALAGRPASDKALELVARYNYTQMNRSGIMGGEEHDLSIGANFYLNKYLGIKLNGSYVWTGEHCNNFYQKDFFLVQARLQYVF